CHIAEVFAALLRHKTEVFIHQLFVLRGICQVFEHFSIESFFLDGFPEGHPHFSKTCEGFRNVHHVAISVLCVAVFQVFLQGREAVVQHLVVLIKYTCPVFVCFFPYTSVEWVHCLPFAHHVVPLC